MKRGPVTALLIRHFFDRFFDNEALSPQADALTNLGPMLGLLATPAAFGVLVILPLTLRGWGLVTFRYWFVALSMITMALLVVLKWDAMFPDRRDYQILTPLPLRPATLFLAKTAALALFLILFLADVNFFGALMWPAIDTGGGSLKILGAHLSAVAASGLFGALAAAAVQGILINVFSGPAYRRISTFVQMLLIAVLVMALFLTPLIAETTQQAIRLKHPVLHWFPGFWFIGLYERLRPATQDRVLYDLGGYAIHALWIAAGVFVVTYVPGYRRYARKMLEAPAARPSGPGVLRAATRRILNATVLRTPGQRAVFWFISQTITRSMKHRLFVAIYGGFGAALAVLSLFSGPAGFLKLPLTLSFVLVSCLRAAFNFPSELRANQAFQINGTGAASEYLAAMRKWVVLCALLPLFLVMLPCEFLWFSAGAALYYIACDFTLSLLLVEIMFFGFRKAPFTCSYFPGKVNLVGLSVFYIFGFTAYSSVMASLEAWLVDYPAVALLWIVITVAAWVALVFWRLREARPNALVDYEDGGDPAVRTLELMAPGG